jgi:putative nucleotidyltransferase with HDIG domain
MPISEEILRKIEQLPTLPMVVTRIMQLIENPRTSAAEITKVISLDPALTVKILKLVNSAYYGFPKKIGTITHAIMILGFEDVKNIALSVSVFDIFKGDGDGELFDRTAFWQHAIATGVCAKLLAKRLKYKNLEEAFIAGLLHDVGKIVIDQYFHEELKTIVKRVKEQNCLFINAERHLYDMDHTEIGRIVAKKWGLPQQIVDCVAFHHDPTSRKDLELLVSIVHASDIFVRIQKIGSGGDDLVPQLKKEAWEKLKLQPTELKKLYEELHAEYEKADAFLELTKKNENVRLKK